MESTLIVESTGAAAQIKESDSSNRLLERLELKQNTIGDSGRDCRVR